MPRIPKETAIIAARGHEGAASQTIVGSASCIFQDDTCSPLPVHCFVRSNTRSIYTPGLGERGEGFIARLTEVFRRLSSSELAKMLLFTCVLILYMHPMHPVRRKSHYRSIFLDHCWLVKCCLTCHHILPAMGPLRT